MRYDYEKLPFEQWLAEVNEACNRLQVEDRLRQHCWLTHSGVGIFPADNGVAIHFSERPLNALEPGNLVDYYAIDLVPLYESPVAFFRGRHVLNDCPYYNGPAELLREVKNYLLRVGDAPALQAFQALRLMRKFDAEDRFLAAAQLVVEVLGVQYRTEADKQAAAYELRTVLLEFFWGRSHAVSNNQS